MIYFDNAATTGHKPKTVVNSYNYAINNISANPGRSGHTLSQKAANIVYKAREKISDFFDSDGPETIVFTANCTTSINFVLKGVLSKGDHVIISDLEHNAVTRPLNSMNADYTIATVSLNDDGETVRNFENSIKSNTKMIFCTAASNVIGKILPLKKIGEICKKHNILFGVDAAQGAGIIPIKMKEMNIDFLCIAPHKGLYCPMGFGVLIARKQIDKTIIEGGTGTNSLELLQPHTMPEKFESGTVNLPAISTINAGIEFVKSNADIMFKKESLLVKRLYDGLKNENYIFYLNPNNNVNAPVISFNYHDIHSEVIAQFLNNNGFAVRSGLHCAPLAHKKIGTLSQGTVRVSPSIFNNIGEIDLLIYTLKKFKKHQKHY